MGVEPSLAELLKQAKEIRDEIGKADAERVKIFDEMRADIKKHGQMSGDTEAKVVKAVNEMTEMALKSQALEDSINKLWKHVSRPGFENPDNDAKERASAIEMLEHKHQLKVVKKDPEHPFDPTDDQIKEAIVANKAINALMNTTDIANLPADYRKALSAFNFGSNGFILAPQMSNRVLSCLLDPSDVVGLMDGVTISGPSIIFPIDNSRLDAAAWACEANCFANNPQAHLTDGLGQLEIKPETLRYIVCATRDILEDASMNVESWMINKVQRAFRATISAAIINGDGIGKPMGLLNPMSGIPVCDTSDHTTAGSITWQDLIALKWQVPLEFQGGGTFLMNQATFGMLLTMSDATGRPIISAMPQGTAAFVMNGSPIVVVSWMPNIAPGATPVAFGNWREVYMVVNRKAVTMQQDPYSAGFCILYKFESRIGGGIICPNAARLLRIQ